jgi:hypothetical protein
MGVQEDLTGAQVGTARKRSKAWIYYLILAVGSLIAVCTGQVIGLLGMALFGWYSRYLYRGGRVVIWFW